MKVKTTRLKYRIANWKEYNRALINRGSLNLYFTAEVINGWLNYNKSGLRGKSNKYTDVAINFILMIRELFHLPLRATQGLVESLMKINGIDLPVPHYSTLSRRARELEVKLIEEAKQEPIRVIADSTGMKQYGEGEWKVKIHGVEKSRTWIKLHITIDQQSRHIIATVNSHPDLHDGKCVEEMLEQIDSPIAEFRGDGAYDCHSSYKPLSERAARAIVPPKKNAVITNDPIKRWRDENLRIVQELGMEQWKKLTAYHFRNLVENAIFRLKTIFSERLRSRRIQTQSCEMRIRCAVLNRMTSLGMPVSYTI
jgi:hypothetical protein